MTHAAKSATLKVPGARIHYEMRGTGPLLLIIPGGPAGRRRLRRFRRPPRRPLHRRRLRPARAIRAARFDGPPEELVLGCARRRRRGADPGARTADRPTCSEPAAAPTSGSTSRPAIPELVRALVAHEPPSMMLLPDPSKEVAAAESPARHLPPRGRRRRDGEVLRRQRPGGRARAEEPPPEFAPTPEDAETFARVSGNFEYWLAHGLRPLSFYRPDVEALRAGKPRVVVGIGEQSAGQPIERMAMALAEQAGHRAGPLPRRPHGLRIPHRRLRGDAARGIWLGAFGGICTSAGPDRPPGATYDIAASSRRRSAPVAARWSESEPLRRLFMLKLSAADRRWATCLAALVGLGCSGAIDPAGGGQPGAPPAGSAAGKCGRHGRHDGSAR